MRVSYPTLLALFAASARALEDEEPSETTQVPECTATSQVNSGAFFDLRPDIAWPEDSGKTHKSNHHKDYHARGYDYGKNFTINVCNSVVDPVTNVVGVEEERWANVSAYYMSQGDIYSIGTQTMDLKTRGRKLVLQYVNGSPCGDSKAISETSDLGPYGDKEYMDGETDAARIEEEKNRSIEEIEAASEDGQVRRKSTIISFICDREPASTGMSIVFVGTDPDECAYFFEARSSHACASAEPHKPGSVGPGSIFGLILIIAVLVYFLGGVFFNRTVNHARGWRQLPNYTLWAGMWSFFSDMFVIATSSCARFLPGRRGYSHLSSTDHPRNRSSEAENRLIDQLDEEWDD